MDLLASGELLIDFTPVKGAEPHQYIANPGGAPCNFLTMASMAGVSTGFIGKVGNDAFGQMLKAVIEEKGIDPRGLVLSKEQNTTLAFVHLEEGGERNFSFYRKGCADTTLTMEEVDPGYLRSADLFHFGSLSFTDEPGRSTLLNMLNQRKALGRLISYDPNYRASLWNSEETARKRMLIGLGYADLLKVSEEELLFLTGERDLAAGCSKLAAYGIDMIFVTLGEEGVYYHTKQGSGRVAGFLCQVVDTTGAGDTFFGAAVAQILKQLHKQDLPIKRESLSAIQIEDLEEILRYANCAASICIERYGGIPAIPTDEEVQERLR